MKAHNDLLSGLPVWVKASNEGRTLVFDAAQAVGSDSRISDSYTVAVTPVGRVEGSVALIPYQMYLAEDRYLNITVFGGLNYEDYKVEAEILDDSDNIFVLRAILKVRDGL